MSKFYVYGLRLKGDKEVRYIGQTNDDPIYRFRTHMTRARSAGGMRVDPWLLENEGSVEAFKIAACETREEAQSMERAITALCVRLDHRLFNKQAELLQTELTA
jgi:predicted GIY-YIG superfamily endonuclease